MKKIDLFSCALVFLFFVSCSDETSDPQAVKEPVTATPAAIPPVKKDATIVTEKVYVETKTKDTARTEISISQKGGSVKTKKGSDVSIDEKGVKLGTKDIKIVIKRDTN